MIRPLSSHFAFAFTAMLLACGLLTQVSLASIQIDSVDIVAVARVFTATSTDNFTNTAIPTPPTNVNAAMGSSHSNNVISFSQNGGQTIFDIEMDNSRNGNGSVAFAGILAGFNATGAPLIFTSDTDTPYSLSGFYNMVGEGSVRIDMQLHDITANQTIFSNSQFSAFTPNEQFILGAQGGDQPGPPPSSGLTGNLFANHQYAWSFQALLPQDGAISTASGRFTLTIGEAGSGGVVPEATSFFIWGLLGFSAFIPRLRRRQLD